MKTKERAYWQQYIDEFRRVMNEARQVLSPREYDRTLSVIRNAVDDERIENAARLYQQPVATPTNN